MFKLFQIANNAYFKLGQDLNKMQFKYLCGAYQQYLEPTTVDQ